MIKIELALISRDDDGNIRVLTPEEHGLIVQLLGVGLNGGSAPRVKVPHAKGVLLSEAPARQPFGSSRKVFTLTDEEMRALYKKHGSIASCAAVTGYSKSTWFRRWRKLKKGKAAVKVVAESKKSGETDTDKMVRLRKEGVLPIEQSELFSGKYTAQQISTRLCHAKKMDVELRKVLKRRGR